MSDTRQDFPENLVDLMDKLIEPDAPDPVSMMPQTWGWTVLAGLILVALGAGLWRWSMRYRANAYRRAALVELEQARDLRDVAKILRRTALAGFPRADVAGLSGASWLAFLQSTGGFPEAAGADLVVAPYRADPQPVSPQARHAARHWIRHHARPGA